MTEKVAQDRKRKQGSGLGTLVYAGVLLLSAWTLRLVSRIGVRTTTRSPAEVATYLRDYLTGAESFWDWDDFTSTQILDPKLDSIRVRAKAASATESLIDFSVLQQLLDEAEGLILPNQ